MSDVPEKYQELPACLAAIAQEVQAQFPIYMTADYVRGAVEGVLSQHPDKFDDYAVVVDTDINSVMVAIKHTGEKCFLSYILL